jgi:hypothetical protein
MSVGIIIAKRSVSYVPKAEDATEEPSNIIVC